MKDRPAFRGLPGGTAPETEKNQAEPTQSPRTQDTSTPPTATDPPAVVHTPQDRPVLQVLPGGAISGTEKNQAEPKRLGPSLKRVGIWLAENSKAAKKVVLAVVGGALSYLAGEATATAAILAKSALAKAFLWLAIFLAAIGVFTAVFRSLLWPPSPAPPRPRGSAESFVPDVGFESTADIHRARLRAESSLRVALGGNFFLEPLFAPSDRLISEGRLLMPVDPQRANLSFELSTADRTNLDEWGFAGPPVRLGRVGMPRSQTGRGAPHELRLMPTMAVQLDQAMVVLEPHCQGRATRGAMVLSCALVDCPNGLRRESFGEHLREVFSLVRVTTTDESALSPRQQTMLAVADSAGLWSNPQTPPDPTVDWIGCRWIRQNNDLRPNGLIFLANRSSSNTRADNRRTVWQRFLAGQPYSLCASAAEQVLLAEATVAERQSFGRFTVFLTDSATQQPRPMQSFPVCVPEHWSADQTISWMSQRDILRQREILRQAQ